MKPEEYAARLIDEYCIESPKDLIVEEIAAAENLFIKEAPLNNFLGMINYKENCGLITINSNITDKSQRIFTITHEMGHFFIERSKPERLRGCKAEELSAFKSVKKNEENANIFAAELLMHRPWFNDFIVKREINFELIKELATYFNVSLTAAAFRYVNIGKYPTAIVYSKDGIVKWSAFHDYFPFKFIAKGFKVPNESAAIDFFKNKEMQTVYDLVPAKAWFAGDFKCKASTYLYEQNVGMPAYNAVLTLMWESEFD
jgi:Zn-dependent peptidase ImmA (M78 family)